MAANLAKLIKVRSITLTRAEGRHEEVGKPITLLKGQHPDMWAAADKVLYGWSTTAPKEGGYDKCDFVIEYDDGEKYTGRFDLYHHSIEFPNLSKHVYDFVRFTSGKYKGALTQEEYDKFKEQEHFKKLAPEFAKFLDKYEIGAYNLAGLKANTKLQHRGKDPEAIKVAERFGLSFDGMQDHQYQFTVQEGPKGAKGITFYVKNLSEIEGRLKEKLEQFGLSTQTLPPSGKMPAVQRAALQKLGNFTIIHTHDDGDLTVRAGDKQYIVATSGEVYVHTGHLAKKGGNGSNDPGFQMKSLPDEPKRRPKQEGDLELIPDSPEFVAQTVAQSGWREKLDEEFNAAVERTRR